MDTIPEAIMPPIRRIGTTNPSPKMVSTTRPAPNPADPTYPTAKMASTTTAPSPQPVFTSLANPDNDKILNRRNGSSYFAALVRYWGPQWRSPKPDKSQELLAVAVFVFASLYFLRHLTQHCLRAEGGSGGALPALVLLKTVSLGYQIYLGNNHAVLRRRAYGPPVRAHEPVVFGFLAACVGSVARTAALGYAPDADLLLYWVEVWFWAAYWVEWWTGVYSQYMLGELGII